MRLSPSPAPGRRRRHRASKDARFDGLWRRMRGHRNSHAPHPSASRRGEGASTLGGPQEIGLDCAGHADRQQIALAVAGLADRGANPVLADAVFLDVVPLTALEPNADAPGQRRAVVERALGVDAEMIGRLVGRGECFARPGVAAIVEIAGRGNRRRLSSPAPLRASSTEKSYARRRSCA
jgi:hypothetical protein